MDEAKDQIDRTFCEIIVDTFTDRELARMRMDTMVTPTPKQVTEATGLRRVPRGFGRLIK